MSIIKQGIHPIVCSKIILQLCYTKALYGCELWNNITNNEMLLLERAHRYVCKYVQGLPKLTRTHKCITLLGWTSIECYIDSKKNYYFLVDYVICLPGFYRNKYSLHVYYYKWTIVQRLEVVFIPDIIKIVRKYDMFSYVDNFVKTSSFSSSKKWKYIVKSSVIAYEEHSLHERFNIDTGFTYFRLIQEYCHIVLGLSWKVISNWEHSVNILCRFVR